MLGSYQFHDEALYLRRVLSNIKYIVSFYTKIGEQ